LIRAIPRLFSPRIFADYRGWFLFYPRTSAQFRGKSIKTKAAVHSLYSFLYSSWQVAKFKEMEMADILPLVEHNFKRWKAEDDEQSLHEGFVLLTSAMERRDEAEKRQQKLDARHQELLAESNILKTELRAMHQRFDDTLHYMDKRFDDTLHHMDRRFESMDKRFNLLTWMIGLGFTVVVTIASLYNFL
jgi:hypothetical protein